MNKREKEERKRIFKQLVKRKYELYIEMFDLREELKKTTDEDKKRELIGKMEKIEEKILEILQEQDKWKKNG